MDQSYTLIVKRDGNIIKLREFKNFKLMEIVEKLTADKFLEKIELFKKDAIKITNSVFIDTGAIGESILYVYYLLGYENKLFGICPSVLEKKLLQNAKKLLLFIEMGTDLSGNGNIHQIVETYFSLFKIWSSKEQLNDIDKYFSIFMATMSVYQYNKEKGHLNGTVTDHLIELMDTILDIDFIEAYKLLLLNYPKMKICKSLCHHFWKNIKAYNEKERLLYPLLIELGTVLIKTINDESKADKLRKLFNPEVIADIVRASSNEQLEEIYKTCLIYIFEVNQKDVSPSVEECYFTRFSRLFRLVMAKTI